MIQQAGIVAGPMTYHHRRDDQLIMSLFQKMILIPVSKYDSGYYVSKKNQIKEV